MKYDIVLLTEDRYVNPEKVDWYVQQVLDEDLLVEKALEKKGLNVTKKSWSDPTFDWGEAKFLLFRTTWDYFNRFEEFIKWLDKTEKVTSFINPYQQIRWNMDKHYLLDLEKKGINIVPSYFIPKGNQETLSSLHQQHDLSESVIKPTVSGAGRHTYRLTKENIASHESLFKELIQEEDFILQPFLTNITSKGEVSHVMIGGEYSHSILKLAKKGDYRVQDDFGGTIHRYAPSKEEIIFAQECVKACTPIPAYARVDVVWDNEDNYALSEIELIEPELWFRMEEKAATLLADHIAEVYF